MNPIFEKQEDRDNESAVMRDMEAAFDCEATKLPMGSRLDYLLTRDAEFMAVAEVKCRNMTSDEHKTIVLSLSKWTAGINYWKHNALQFLVVFRLLDTTLFYKYDPNDKFEIKMGGRTVKTRDEGDIEVCVYIPVDKMRILKSSDDATPTNRGGSK